jgi:UDP-glucuronate 4-epimerase
VFRIDNMCPYYDVSLKQARLGLLQRQPGFRFAPIDIADRAPTAALFERKRFDRIGSWRRQVGVRYSLEQPLRYVDSNVGFADVLGGARAQRVRQSCSLLPRLPALDATGYGAVQVRPGGRRGRQATGL